MKKAWCEGCGYTIRLTKKWIDFAPPKCPMCSDLMRHELEGHEKPDPKQLNLVEGK